MLLKTARRLVILVVGSTVLLIGVALIVLPGPAILVIPAGLAILGTEFLWARRLLRRMKQTARDAVSGLGRPFRSTATKAPAAESGGGCPR